MAMAGEVPGGTFDNAACIACHEKREKALVGAWRSSAHGKDGPAADCIACHGDTHTGATIKARRNDTCIACHGGEKEPVVHSYATSKHGVIYRLEQEAWDWSLPLERANYRAPGCAYCHMHRGNHNVSASVRPDIMSKTGSESVQNALRAVCQECHSPRYVTTLFENGEEMLELGRMKLREASALLEAAAGAAPDSGPTAAKARLVKMRAHLRNVYLGIGHQSPDYQWWHGQPALDGDLLRIKGAVGDWRRRRAIDASAQGRK